MLGFLATVLGAELISEIVEDNEKQIFEMLDDKAFENNIRPTSFVETRRGNMVYRVYGDGHREKERI